MNTDDADSSAKIWMHPDFLFVRVEFKGSPPSKMLHKELTDQIINAFCALYNQLGYGFLERVYENALLIELENRGLHCTRQHALKVYYQGIEVGSYFAPISS
jgi:PD-(D/E)XK nuclease superfamily